MKCTCILRGLMSRKFVIVQEQSLSFCETIQKEVRPFNCPLPIALLSNHRIFTVCGSASASYCVKLYGDAKYFFQCSKMQPPCGGVIQIVRRQSIASNSRSIPPSVDQSYKNCHSYGLPRQLSEHATLSLVNASYLYLALLYSSK